MPPHVYSGWSQNSWPNIEFTPAIGIANLPYWSGNIRVPSRLCTTDNKVTDRFLQTFLPTRRYLLFRDTHIIDELVSDRLLPDSR